MNQSFEDKKAARRAKVREDPKDDWLKDIAAEETGTEMDAAMAKGGFVAYVQAFIEVSRTIRCCKRQWMCIGLEGKQHSCPSSDSSR